MSEKIEVKEILQTLATKEEGEWFRLPDKDSREELAKIKETARTIRKDSKFLVCIGDIGACLGQQAVIRALGLKGSTKILYAGNSFSTIEIHRLLKEIGKKHFSINVIITSKASTETIAIYRFLKQRLVEKYGEKNALKRIYFTVGDIKGELADEIEEQKVEKIEIPKGVCEQFAVLSVAGLLPMAVAGIKIEEILKGAKECREQLKEEDASGLEVVQYAKTRRELYKKGYRVEILASFEPCMYYFQEWWRYLFTEDKEKTEDSILPIAVQYTKDLSIIEKILKTREGEVFETFIKFEDMSEALVVPKSKREKDDLAEKSFHYLSDQAFIKTVKKHQEKKVATLVLEMEKTEKGLSERMLGYMIFFFEVASRIFVRID